MSALDIDPKLRRAAVAKVGRCQGFSLLEVLVAFTILGIALTVLMQVFSTGLRNITVGEDYTRAVLLAESRLASVGVEEPLQEGEQSGSFDGPQGYRWRVVISLYDLKQEEETARREGRLGADPRRTQQGIQPGLGPGASFFGLGPLGADAVPLVKPYQVMVQVLWGPPERERSVALTTLRLQPAETDAFEP